MIRSLKTHIEGEPLSYSMIVGLSVAVAIDYGLNVKDSLATLITYVGPVILATIGSRWLVTPVSKAKNAIDEAYLMEPGEKPIPTL